jgi:hypothetical protein
MMEAIGSSETPILTRTTRRNIPEHVILHSHRRGKKTSNLLSPVRYKLRFYIPEDDIRHSHRRENSDVL